MDPIPPALLREAQAALRTPVEARVVGERVRVLAIEQGAGRRGLVARVARRGASHTVSLADLDAPPGSALAGVVAGYRAFLDGDAPSAGAPPAAAPEADVEAGGLAPGATVEAAVLSVKDTSARCRVAGGETLFTLRYSGVWNLVPGELATVRLKKVWRQGGQPHASGEVQGSRLAVERLGLTPLRLERLEEWDPAEEDWGEGGVPDWAERIVARGPRPAFELELVIPGADPDDWDGDPIVEAVEMREAGDHAGARALLMEQLAQDLRCLDAHAHLGNQELERAPRLAIRHYQAGVRIGELSLGPAFYGLLPWSVVENRPFLRCLHGLGLCLWRLGRREEAAAAFERMLWLDPSDHQGARFLLEDVRGGLSWEEQQEREERRLAAARSAAGQARRLPVDLQDLALALEDHEPGHTWFLDLQTGEVFLVTDDELGDEDLPVPRDELESDRFEAVEPEETRLAYREMVEFAETVRQPRLRERLADALAGKGAFGRFKRVLADHPEQRERWFTFRNARLEARAREWLESIGVVPEPRRRA